jgi:putative NADPH-quinone reductase
MAHIEVLETKYRIFQQNQVGSTKIIELLYFRISHMYLDTIYSSPFPTFKATLYWISKIFRIVVFKSEIKMEQQSIRCYDVTILIYHIYIYIYMVYSDYQDILYVDPVLKRYMKVYKSS